MCKLCAALFVLALSAGIASSTEDEAAYFKLRVYGDNIYYGVVQGDELRVAETPEKLPDVNPRIARKEFRGISLLVPKEDVPEGLAPDAPLMTMVTRTARVPAAPKMGQIQYETIQFADIQIRLFKYGPDKARWSYRFVGSVKMTPDIEDAPEVVTGDLSEALKLDITTTVTGKALGIGVKLMSGTFELDSILRNGQPSLLEVAVIDKNGEMVQKMSGHLFDFGFS